MSTVTSLVALFFLAASLALSLVSLTTSDGWVVDRNVRTYSQHVSFLPNSWFATWSPPSLPSVSTGSQSYSSFLYSQLGLPVYLDSSSHWSSAGAAALSLGALGVAFTGLSALVVLHALARGGSSWVSVCMSWLGGFCLILGGVLYEALRPSFHGDVGYEYPFALYLVAGISTDLAAWTLQGGSAKNNGPSGAAKL